MPCFVETGCVVSLAQKSSWKGVVSTTDVQTTSWVAALLPRGQGREQRTLIVFIFELDSLQKPVC